MKKQYNIPELSVFELNMTQQVLAGSVKDNGDGTLTVGKGGDFSGESGDVLGRSFDFTEE